MQDYNFACGSVWVWNLVSDIKGRTQTEGVWEHSAEENIWTEEEWGDRRLNQTAQWGASWLILIKSKSMRWAGYAARIGER
jgi:hypothetical protein